MCSLVHFITIPHEFTIEAKSFSIRLVYLQGISGDIDGSAIKSNENASFIYFSFLDYYFIIVDDD